MPRSNDRKQRKTRDLHGSAPDDSRVALPCFRACARQARVPVVYVNDNFARWRSDFRSLLQHCLKEGVRGKPIAELLKPEPDDCFVLKPKHSAFQFTALDVLLQHLGAHDVYMRDYRLVVPRDCVASQAKAENRYALEHMTKVTKAAFVKDRFLGASVVFFVRLAPTRD
jgi:nicotinamidase-related amidase